MSGQFQAYPTQQTSAILPGTTVRSQWIFITHQMAGEWLKKNHPNQRNQYATLRGKYTLEMTAGEWVTTHQGIAFDEEGYLIDGQHRLKSIEESGIGVWMLVTFNLPIKAREAIDLGKSRAVHDMMQIEGDRVDADHVAVARVMISAPDLFQSKHIANSKIRKYIRDNFEAITYSRMLFPKKAGPAAFRGCVAKAWKSHDFAKLERFGKAAQDLIPFDQMTAVDHMARRKMEQLTIVTGGEVSRNLAYRKFQRLLLAYLQDELLVNLCEATEDLFPDPNA